MEDTSGDHTSGDDTAGETGETGATDDTTAPRLMVGYEDDGSGDVHITGGLENEVDEDSYQNILDLFSGAIEEGDVFEGDDDEDDDLYRENDDVLLDKVVAPKEVITLAFEEAGLYEIHVEDENGKTRTLLVEAVNEAAGEERWENEFKKGNGVEFFKNGNGLFDSDVALDIEIAGADSLGIASLAPGDQLQVKISVNPGLTKNPALGIFVVMTAPSGGQYSLTAPSVFVEGVTTIIDGWTPADKIKDYEIVNVTLPESIPPGEWKFYFAADDGDGDIAADTAKFVIGSGVNPFSALSSE
jgi:hypothetical protein